MKSFNQIHYLKNPNTYTSILPFSASVCVCVVVKYTSMYARYKKQLMSQSLVYIIYVYVYVCAMPLNEENLHKDVNTCILCMLLHFCSC